MPQLPDGSLTKMSPRYKMIPTHGIGIMVGGTGWTFNPWATFRFLDLPPEIRNKIYDLVVPSCRMLILGNHPQREINHHKRKHGCKRAPPMPYRLRSILLSGTVPDELAAAIAFLKVCRKCNHEVTSMLYSRTIFRFRTIKHINKFLNSIPQPGREDITSIEISYSAYGEPRWTKDEYWKIKNDWKWLTVCQRLKTDLPSLQNVDLDIRVADWPIQLKSSNYCFEPLDMLAGSGLQKARVCLSHYRIHPNRCGAVARALEDMMMTPEGIEMRDMADAVAAVREMQEKEACEAARKALLPPVRAKKVLVIKNIPKETEDKTGTKSRLTHTKPLAQRKLAYRTKGLEGWARVNLDTVGVTWTEAVS